MTGTLAVMLAFGLILTGCSIDTDDLDGGNNDGSRASNLVGKWLDNDDFGYEFKADGKFLNCYGTGSTSTAFTWTVSAGTITLSIGDEKMGSAKYSIAGTTLTISEAEGQTSLRNGTYTKQGGNNNPGNTDGGNNLLNGKSYTAVGSWGNEWTLFFTSATEWEHLHLLGAGERDTGTLNTMGSSGVKTIRIAGRTYYTDY
jgi:hypothetical protein